jgi:hypothetical protein
LRSAACLPTCMPPLSVEMRSSIDAAMVGGERGVGVEEEGSAVNRALRWIGEDAGLGWGRAFLCVCCGVASGKRSASQEGGKGVCGMEDVARKCPARGMREE